MARRRMTGLGATAILVTVLAALVSCGVGQQDGVTRINPADLGELDQTVPDVTTVADSTTTVPNPSTTMSQPVSSPTVATTPQSTVTATMYFISGEGLVAVPMELPPEAVQSVRSYLDALAAGPPDPAAAEGIRSAIPADLVSSVQIRSDGITVDLDGDRFSTVDNQDQQLLIGQMVLSLTSLPDVPGLRQFNRVRFTLDGAPLPVLRRDNSRTEPGEYVTADDYTQLLVDASPATTATPNATGTDGQ